MVPVGGTASLDLRMSGRPVLDWTLSALAEATGLVEIVVVGEVDLPALQAPIPVRLVRLEGGGSRTQALRAGLASAAPAPRVVVHDGDRPLTSAALVDAILQAAEGSAAAVAAIQARNTLKEVVGGRICRTVPRERVYQVQPPAIFERTPLEEALARDRTEGWNCHHELELAARAGLRPLVVPGDPLNVPVTLPESVAFAELVKGRAPSLPAAPAGSAAASHATGRSGVAAVVVAAGAGRRMGAPRNKVFLPVGGRPILARTLQLFQSDPEVDLIVLVAASSELDECRAELLEPYGLTKVRRLVPGGRTRHESEHLGIEALAPEITSGAVEVVMVHDGVRPFTEPGHLLRAAAVARELGGAVVGVPAGRGLVRTAPGGWLEEGVGELWAAQTPQAFGARLLLDAHRRATADGFEGTDTSSVVERAGHQVGVVEGSYDNIKITTATDLPLAEEVARRQGGGGRFLTGEVVNA